MVVAVLLKWVGLGLSVVTALVIMMGFTAWLSWFRFPRFTQAVSELAYHVSTFCKHLAKGAGLVASAPFRMAEGRLELLRHWAAQLHRRAKTRLRQLKGDVPPEELPAT